MLSLVELIEATRTARTVDLAQPCFAGMPHWPTHPRYVKAGSGLVEDPGSGAVAEW